MSDGITEGLRASMAAREDLMRKGWTKDRTGCFLVDPLTREPHWLPDAEKIQASRESEISGVMTE